MTDKFVHINVPGPESIIVCEEARFDLIAQVARALTETRHENGYDWDSNGDESDSVFDFTELFEQDFN